MFGTGQVLSAFLEALTLPLADIPVVGKPYPDAISRSPFQCIEV
jgi:hypothetical protein